MSASQNQGASLASGSVGGNTGVVINELLCFLSNKTDSMPADLVRKLIFDFYDEKEIEAAKGYLFDLQAPTNSQRLIKRKGPNRKNADIQDMQQILLSLDVAEVPCFVARDLSQLPPLSQDHFDLSSVLKDFQELKSDIEAVKDIRREVTLLKESLGRNAESRDCVQRVHVTTEATQTYAEYRGQTSGTEQPVKTGPQQQEEGETPSTQAEPIVVGGSVAEDAQSQGFNASSTSHHDNMHQEHDRSQHTVHSQDGSLLNLSLDSHDSVEFYITIDNLDQSPSVHERSPVNSPGWTTVPAVRLSRRQRHSNSTPDRSRDQRNRRNRTGARCIVGRRQSHPLVQPARGNVLHQQRKGKGLFVTRLHATTSESDVNRFIRTTTNLRLSVSKLRTRHEGYTSFFIPLGRQAWDHWLDPTIWPEGVLVKEFQ